MGKKFMGLGGTDHFWDRAKAWILNQITSAVTAKIAEVVANAPEDLDTLKEIADWISTHADDAAAMNTQITENKNNIAANSNSISAMNTAILANTEAIKGLIKTKDIPVGDITMPATNYFEISTDLTSSDIIISAKLSSWSSNTDCFSIICYKNNYVYIIAKSGTVIKNISVTVFYI